MTLGQAYGIFNCNAPKNEIEAELPDTKRITKSPSELELLLVESDTQLSLPDDMADIVQNACDDGFKYVLRATCPNYTNEQTATELTDYMNNLYLSKLYQKDEQFDGGVVYRGDDGQYLFK